jgi:Holliday junction resolvase
VVPPSTPETAPRGDRKKVDFEARKGSQRFALEVKWARETPLSIRHDYEKLLAFHNDDKHNNALSPFLVVSATPVETSR